MLWSIFQVERINVEKYDFAGLHKLLQSKGFQPLAQSTGEGDDVAAAEDKASKAARIQAGTASGGAAAANSSNSSAGKAANATRTTATNSSSEAAVAASEGVDGDATQGEEAAVSALLSAVYPGMRGDLSNVTLGVDGVDSTGATAATNISVASQTRGGDAADAGMQAALLGVASAVGKASGEDGGSAGAGAVAEEEEWRAAPAQGDQVGACGRDGTASGRWRSPVAGGGAAVGCIFDVECGVDVVDQPCHCLLAPQI